MRPMVRLTRFRDGLLIALAACAAVSTAAENALPVSSGQPVPLDREALSQPLPGLEADDLRRFQDGRALFHQSWIVAPAGDSRLDGLGPLYNRLACISCHAKNGRGGAPEGPSQRMQSMLMRLSVPGLGPHGGPRPHPVYGDQLNEEGIAGVPGEGRAQVHWQTRRVTLAGGQQVQLRQPRWTLSELAYGPLVGVQTSARVSPAVAGLGLLEAVPEAVLLARQAERKPDGVKGRVNRVWDIARQQVTVGRFGLKANAPDLRQQIAGAFQGDMGLTTSLLPADNCQPAQTACRAAPSGGQPEVDDEQLGQVEFYLAHLAPPPRREPEHPEVRRGEWLFSRAGCAVCHLPALPSGPHPRFARVNAPLAAAYTDLLLHDMGPRLADGRPDHLATGREWRTAPLWGLGLLPGLNEQVGWLHDGRARSPEEAILWHGGEARVARQRYLRLPAADRAALLRFLRSL